MWCMAIGAIFGHWLVFPQEGTALLGMTGEARFGHRVLLEQLGTGRTMGVMAV